MLVSTQENGVEKALMRLREVHTVLSNLLEKDEHDLEEATTNTHLVEAALRLANTHEDWSDQPPSTQAGDLVSSMHPILRKLNISGCN
jgi:hypothetical protein